MPWHLSLLRKITSTAIRGWVKREKPGGGSALRELLGWTVVTLSEEQSGSRWPDLVTGPTPARGEGLRLRWPGSSPRGGECNTRAKVRGLEV